MTRRPIRHGTLIPLVASLTACGDVGGGSGEGERGADAGGSGEIDGLAAISVEPAGATLVIDGDAPATETFRAIGEFDDGRTEDLTDRASFSIRDTALGAFAGPELTTNTHRGGISRVTARAGGLQGGTEVTVVLRKRHGDSEAELPSDPGAIFDGAEEDDAMAPEIVYPAPEVFVPPNLEELEIHLIPPDGGELFELRFDSPTTDVAVYTSCVFPMGEGCIYLPEPQVWRWIAESNRGGRVELTARAVDAEGDAAGASPPQPIAFSQDDIRGAIYYWTTSGGADGDTAIVRYDFAADQIEPELVISESDTNGDCVGCHTLSPDGATMFTAADGSTGGRVLLTDLQSGEPIVPFDSTPRNAFAAFNPEGDRFVGVYANEGSGFTSYQLNLFDAADGTFIEEIDVGGEADHPSNHPDWSPDGDRIVFSRVGEIDRPATIARGSQSRVGMVEREGDDWSEPVFLTDPPPGSNTYYATFAPEGDLLALNQSSCDDEQNSRACDGYADANATLYAMRPELGAEPVELARANEPGATDGVDVVMNSFPKWTPFTFQRTGEFGTRVYWLSFASNRMYGLREPGAEPYNTLLWMAAVDPDAALSGHDGSSPAFAIPFQALDTNNHTAQWTETTVIVD